VYERDGSISVETADGHRICNPLEFNIPASLSTRAKMRLHLDRKGLMTIASWISNPDRTKHKWLDDWMPVNGCDLILTTYSHSIDA
jgi:hypothetical protein